MDSLHADINPFVLMIDPQAVLALIENSERLERLHRRVCRPLDKPAPVPAAAGAGEVSAFDHEVEASEVPAEGVDEGTDED